MTSILSNKARQAFTIVGNKGSPETKAKLRTISRNLRDINRFNASAQYMYITSKFNFETGKYVLKFKQPEDLNINDEHAYKKQIVFGYNYKLYRNIQFFRNIVENKKSLTINNKNKTIEKGNVFYSPTTKGIQKQRRNAGKLNQFYCIYYEVTTKKVRKYDVHYFPVIDKHIIFFKQLKNKNAFVSTLKKNNIKYILNKFNFNKSYNDSFITQKIMNNHRQCDTLNFPY